MRTFFLFFSISVISQHVFAQQDSSAIYLAKGLEEKKAAHFAIADQYFSKAITFRGNNLPALIEKGMVNLSMRKIYDAQQAFQKAYEIDPTNKEAIKQLTEIYFNNRQYQQALAFAEKCTQCPETDRILGLIYYNTEDYGKATTYLEKTLKKNRNDALAAYSLGRTYIELEEERKAIPHYINAIENDSSRYAWKYELGLLYYKLGNWREALNYFDKSVAAGNTRSNDFNENYGFAQLYSGDEVNGLKTVSLVLDKKPNNKELLNNLAAALYQTGKYDLALNYYEKLLTLNPKDAASLYMAGMTFQKKGEKEKGQKICDKAIEMDPSLAKNRQKREMPM